MIIVLSTHFEDAALSLGARIKAWEDEGRKVMILTVMAGSEGVSPEETVVLRAENSDAMRVLGAQSVLLPILHAEHREGQPTADVVDLMVEYLKVISLEGVEKVYAPMARGRHVDHVITREAARRWAQGAEASFFLYEEYPAIEGAPEIDDNWISAPCVTFPCFSDWLERKIHAIACYQSKVEEMFSSEEQMTVEMVSYSTEKGERVWPTKKID